VIISSFIHPERSPAPRTDPYRGGRPVLKRRTGKERRASALALAATIHDRLPERGLLDILTRTAYQIGWTRHFGPPRDRTQNCAVRGLRTLTQSDHMAIRDRTGRIIGRSRR
jgi:predicted secreted Zn-dependent protease